MWKSFSSPSKRIVLAIDTYYTYTIESAYVENFFFKSNPEIIDCDIECQTPPKHGGRGGGKPTSLRTIEPYVLSLKHYDKVCTVIITKWEQLYIKLNCNMNIYFFFLFMYTKQIQNKRVSRTKIYCTHSSVCMQCHVQQHM